MRLVLRFAAGALALLILAGIGFGADVTLNQRRVLYLVLGREGLEAACLPKLAARLREDGFEPTDVEFGEMPDISLSTFASRRLEDRFTFADGASQTRVDGTLACTVRGGAVTVDVETDTTPTRAT